MLTSSVIASTGSVARIFRASSTFSAWQGTKSERLRNADSMVCIARSSSTTNTRFIAYTRIGLISGIHYIIVRLLTNQHPGSLFPRVLSHRMAQLFTSQDIGPTLRCAGELWGLQPD